MAASYFTYRKFNDIELANEIAGLLKQNNIDCVVEDNSRIFEPTFVNGTLNSDIALKLQQPDFAKADKVLEDFYSDSLDTVAGDYYLLSFTNDELRDLVSKPDEWGTFDYLLAQKLLRERGQEIKPETAERLKQERIGELSRPKPVRRGAIIAGYFIAICFSLFGIVVGATFAYLRKTLPNGQRAWAFEQVDRSHGKIILCISIFMVVCWLYLKGIVVVDIFPRKHIPLMVK